VLVVQLVLVLISKETHPVWIGGVGEALWKIDPFLATFSPDAYLLISWITQRGRQSAPTSVQQAREAETKPTLVQEM
jgi:hypothetical protein